MSPLVCLSNVRGIKPDFLWGVEKGMPKLISRWQQDGGEGGVPEGHFWRYGWLDLTLAAWLFQSGSEQFSLA